MNENLNTSSSVHAAASDGALNTRVRDALLGAIQSGELGPGDKLVEVEWANRLGVSRAPVREAFRALEQAGLLEMYRNRGVFVRTVSEHEADELRAVRALLESHACRVLAERLDARHAAELHHLLDSMADATARSDRPRFADLNRAFHDLIVASAGNSKLHGIYRDMIDQLHLSSRTTEPANTSGTSEMSRVAEMSEMTREAMRGSLAEHRALVTALASRDAEAAAQIMHTHIVTRPHTARDLS